MIARHFGTALIATLLLQLLTCERLAHSEDIGPWTATEQFVLAKVQSGNPCDVTTCPGVDKPRISARFLADLLTRWFEVCPTNKEPRLISLTQATITSDIDLANLEVPFEVELTNCFFEGQVNFSKTVFRRSLHLTGSHFATRAAFSAIVIGRSDWSGSLYIDFATFNGDFDITDANVERNLFAANAEFRGTDPRPRFARLTVNGEAHFENASFTGAPVFTQANIKHGFFASGAQFNNRNTRAQFDDLLVGDDVWLDHCRFAGSVDFTDAQTHGDFQAAHAEFQSLENAASFKNVRVEGSLALSETVFSGPADFTHANIGAALDFTNASFLLPSAPVLFHELKLDGDARFDGTTFNSAADFHASRIADELSFRGTHFHGQPDSAFFDHMSISGPASFRRADFTSSVSLVHSTFSTLDLEGVTWPVTLASSWLRLDGLKYERISAGGDEMSWRSLIKLLGYARYNANSYMALEEFYQRIGYPGLADEVFFAQKYRERTDPLLRNSLGTRAWSIFLNVFVRYGRAPWMAFLWGMVIVLLGTVAFTDNKMELQPKDEPKQQPNIHAPDPAQAPSEALRQHSLPGYNAFWYSLDLFAPVIDLEAASAYRPQKKKHPFLYHYSRLHRVLGWILVPIGAAAVTGLTK
jgi:uncharacterized protein YjbI with pentapeptide repeats